MSTSWLGLERLNEMSADDLRSSLTAVCASPAWGAAVVDGRPYADVEALYAVSDRAVAGLDDAELAAALDGHPRIGERPVGEHAAWSRSEQSGMDEAAATTVERIRRGNIAYEARFRHVYLVCASGLGPDRLLSILERRLGNTPEDERGVVLDELAKINRLRLDRVVGSPEPIDIVKGATS